MNIAQYWLLIMKVDGKILMEHLLSLRYNNNDLKHEDEYD